MGCGCEVTTDVLVMLKITAVTMELTMVLEHHQTITSAMAVLMIMLRMATVPSDMLCVSPKP